MSDVKTRKSKQHFQGFKEEKAGLLLIFTHVILHLPPWQHQHWKTTCLNEWPTFKSICLRFITSPSFTLLSSKNKEVKQRSTHSSTHGSEDVDFPVQVKIDELNSTLKIIYNKKYSKKSNLPDVTDVTFFMFFVFFFPQQHVSLLQIAHPSSRAAAADPPILIDGVPSIVTSTPLAMVTPRIGAGLPPTHTLTAHIIHHKWALKREIKHEY